MDESFEALTLLQTGKSAPKPVVMLDRPGGSYWTHWSQFVEGCLLKRGYISSDDLALYRISENVEEAVQVILGFYRIYHSLRYVDHRKTLVLRLKSPLSPERIDFLNSNFGDLVLRGSIRPCPPFPEESDEPEILDLARLRLAFDQHHLGRLRQLIDAINAS